MNYCVYCHTNKTNGKKYIGITQQKVNRRWGNGNGYKHNKYFYSAILKYGWNGFSHDVIMAGLTKENAIELERFLISVYSTTNRERGYNISEGGELGFLGSKREMTDELRAKISKAIRESERFRQNHYAWNKGKHYTEEQKSKYIDAWAYTSEETKAKIRNSVKELWKNDEYKQHMKDVHCGKGLTSVICVETGVEYPSLKEAQAKTGIRYENISKVCSGKHKTAGGFHWKYSQKV